MKKREFFKRLLGITAAAVVAPKVLLAEEEPIAVDPKSMKSYVSSIDFLDQREALPSFPNRMGNNVEEVISCNESVAEVYCKTPALRVGDGITIKRNGKPIGTVCMVTGFSKFPGEDMYRVRFRSAYPKDLDVKKGDFLAIQFSAYAENSPKTKK